MELAVLVDGARVGRSPWKGQVAVGERQVEVFNIRNVVRIRKDQSETVTFAVPRPKTSRTLIIASGALALAAGAGFAIAGATKKSFLKKSPPTQEDKGLKTANHASVITGSVLAGGAIGLGVTAMVVGRW